MVEVIIPALNEEKTIRHIVRACLHAPSISKVHVMVDANTTDNTYAVAMAAGAIVRKPQISGKGELITLGLEGVQSLRVMLCDGDYTRFSPHIAEMATAIHHPYDTMRIIVPKYPTPAQWAVGGAPFPFYSRAWAANSGLRSFPTFMAEDIEFHGYLTETQLNKAAAVRGISVQELYEPAFQQPLRFTERRMQAMEADRVWGVENGVLDA